MGPHSIFLFFLSISVFYQVKTILSVTAITIVNVRYMYIHIHVNIFQELVTAIVIDQVQLRKEIVSHFAFYKLGWCYHLFKC